MRARCVAAALWVTGAVSLGAQSVHDNKYETKEPTAALYQASPFLHGYRDGYQQGFHDADMEMQFAHAASGPREAPHYRKVDYRSEFGDRKTYVTGYRAGFERGYQDLSSGKEFRAFALLKKASGGETKPLPKGRMFNDGVAQGFGGNKKGCESGAQTEYCDGVNVGMSLAKASSR